MVFTSNGVTHDVANLSSYSTSTSLVVSHHSPLCDEKIPRFSNGLDCVTHTDEGTRSEKSTEKTTNEHLICNAYKAGALSSD